MHLLSDTHWNICVLSFPEVLCEEPQRESGHLNMTSSIEIRNQSATGEWLTATFLPHMGMNLMSFKRGNLEVIDQSTKDLFEERFAGLGSIIGPHFHRRNAEILPIIKDEHLFPHIARVKAKGIADPFSHGIARYAPWNVEASENSIKGHLSGKDLWNGTPLSSLEGQNFKMTFSAEMTREGLQLELSVVSDTASLTGIHYYFHLPSGKGTISSRVQNKIIEDNAVKPIPDKWAYDSQQQLQLPLEEGIDCTFYSFPNPLEGNIKLKTDTYELTTTYSCLSQENCWQLYHPAGASYVCIEPVSSQDPRHPNLTVSSININLHISHRESNNV